MRSRKGRWVLYLLAGAAALVAAAWIAAYLTTYHPDDVEKVAVNCPPDAPTVKPGQSLKVLSWNVQFMAGKDRVFYYDLPGDAGPDERPSPEEITRTIEEVARVIRDEDPDLILLQELDEGAKRTDYEDQLARLLELLPDGYRCHSSAFYWKADYVPHPRIRGAVGMKLSTVSKYRISDATRYQLAEIPQDPVTKMFYLKRAVLETRLPVDGEKDLIVLNTHLDAFAQGTDTMQRQVARVEELLDHYSDERHDWVVGGDFNLLPPVPGAYDRLPESQQAGYLPRSELMPLYDEYQAVPGEVHTAGPEPAKWFTHYPNDPEVTGPDRTIDYLFFANTVQVTSPEVRQHDTLRISDHLPVIAGFTLSNH